MSNNGTNTNSHENTDYTQRQMQSSFQPPSNIHPQYSIISYGQPQMPSGQFYQPPLAQQAQYYQGQPFPLNTNMGMVPPYYSQYPPQLQQQQYETNPVNSSDHAYPPPASSTMVNPSPTPTTAMRVDAPSFSPAPKKTAFKETKPTLDQTASSTNNFEITITPTTTISSTTSFIYDLKKYKHNYFISTLSGKVNSKGGRFASPTGICALTDDRLLVANFELDSLALMDINGVVYQIYTDLPSPKDVRYYSTNPSQAVVATKKELVLLDLNTSKVVAKTTMKGFYPWNVHFIQESEIYAACDPSGERVVYFDKDLKDCGGWSFNEQQQQQQQQSSSQYQKVYPYATYFQSNNLSLTLTHRGVDCQLLEKAIDTGETTAIWNIPPQLKAYSIYVDSARKCLIPDKVNHCLVSVDNNSTIEKYTYESIREPYAMTFLSTGTLCVTDWNKSKGTNGGVAIISEIDLTTNT